MRKQSPVPRRYMRMVMLSISIGVGGVSDFMLVVLDLMKEGEGFRELVTAAAEVGCEFVDTGVGSCLHELMLGVETPSVDGRWFPCLEGVHVEDRFADGVFQQLCIQVEYQGASS